MYIVENHQDGTVQFLCTHHTRGYRVYREQNDSWVVSIETKDNALHVETHKVIGWVFADDPKHDLPIIDSVVHHSNGTTYTALKGPFVQITDLDQQESVGRTLLAEYLAAQQESIQFRQLTEERE